MALKLEAPVKPAEMIEDYRHGFHDEENYVFKSDKGLTPEIVERISSMKDEPAWMREFRLKAYELFLQKPMPTWGDTALLNEIDFANIHYFVKSTDQTERSWDDVPDDIKKTFDRLGIPGFLVGAEIAAGVPVLRAVGAKDGAMLLALKSGNFGGTEFFSDALKLMR